MSGSLGDFIGQPYNWARSSDNGYEVSTAGDSRFSAFNALLWDVNEVPAPLNARWTIELYYQIMVKGYESEAQITNLPFNMWWKLAKGKTPTVKYEYKELLNYYVDLWRTWCDNNPKLLEELSIKAKGKVLTDRFASSSINQANALSIILNERYGELS